MDNLGLIIRIAREEAGLTRQQLAEKTGLAVVTIGQYERGVRHPKNPQLQLLADALDVPVNVFSKQFLQSYVPSPDEMPIPGVDYDDDDNDDELPTIQLGPNLGENIRVARQAAGMTQKQLAEQVGVALVTIQQYESERRRPRISHLQRLAEIFGVSVYDLAPSPRFDWLKTVQNGILMEADDVSKSTEKIRLQVDVAYLENHNRNQWLSLMTRDGEESRYFYGQLNDVLYELTPEAIEMVTAFAEFMRQREREYFGKNTDQGSQ